MDLIYLDSWFEVWYAKEINELNSMKDWKSI